MKNKRWKSLLSALLAVSILCAAAVGCGPSNSGEGSGTPSAGSDGGASAVDGPSKETVNVAYGAEPNTFDPHTTGATAARELGRCIYEGLFNLDANYEPQPELCESYDHNEDYTEWTFKLRKGVLFHNGQEMKADDVCASLNRWLAKSGIPSKSIYDGEQFEKVDDYTVKITLTHPVVLLPYILGNNSKFAAIMPASVVEEAGDGNVTEYIGTGPLKFDEWKQTQYVHMVKFDDYQPYATEASGAWGNKTVNYKDIYIRFVTDPSTRMAGIETGEYDVADHLSYDDYDRLMSNSELQVKTDNANTINLIMNKKEGMFTNELYRQALSYAISVEEIMTGSLPKPELFNTTASFFAEVQKTWYVDTSKTVYQDVAKAQELLKQAGYDGTPCRIITTQAFPEFYNAALILQQELEAAGFKTELEVADWATMLNKLTDPGAYDCYVTNYPLASNPASIMYLTSTVNAGFTDDEGLNKMFDELNAQPSIEAASEYWKTTMNAYCNEKAFALNFGDYAYVYALTSKVKTCDLFYGICFWSIDVAE